MNGNEPHDEPEEETTHEPLDDFLHHQRRAYEEMGKALEALFPETFRSHTKVAAKELVESFKVVLEATGDVLEKLAEEFDRVIEDAGDDDDDDGKPTSDTGKTRIEVE